VIEAAERAASLVTERSQPAEPWPEWMSIATAARYLDVEPERLRKLQARRSVPYYQEGPGCRVFFRRSELDEWMSRFRSVSRGA
jgi:excisionase family DNA binding protein